MRSREEAKALFKRIALNRVRRVLKDLEILGKCGNRANYEYTEVEVQKIFDAITSEVEAVRSRFDMRPSVKRSKSFEL